MSTAWQTTWPSQDGYYWLYDPTASLGITLCEVSGSIAWIIGSDVILYDDEPGQHLQFQGPLSVPIFPPHTPHSTEAAR